MKKIPILLTATIIPHDGVIGLKTNQSTSPELRKAEYLTNIKFCLSKGYQVIFAENSGADLSFLNQICRKHKALEVLSVPTMLNLCATEKFRGKGYGEAQIIDYAVFNSKILNSQDEFIKVTGRHKISNIDLINNYILSHEKLNYDFIVEYIFDYHINSNTFPTRVFYTKINFYKSFLLDCHLFVDDHQGVYLEHVYRQRIFEAVLQGKKIGSLPFFALSRGLSTVSGKPIQSRLSILKFFIRQTLKAMPPMIEIKSDLNEKLLS